MGAFGEKLRRQREQRGIELDAISNTTKISTRMLRALEDEHFEQLPGGVFNKGFVRAYARQVGLDEEETVADYLAALRESQTQQQSIVPPAGKPGSDAGPDGRNQLRSEDRRKENRRNDDRRTQASFSPEESTTHPSSHSHTERVGVKYSAGDPALPAAEPSAQIPWGKLALALLLVALALAFWNLRRRREPAAASQPSPAVTQAPVPAPSSAAASPSTPALASANGSASKTPDKPAAPAATAAAKPPATFKLLIRAEKTTWISITADGKPVAEETLIAPAHTSVRASREIVVKAGNAAGISFLLNDKEIPAQGSDGEVKTYVFDATSVHVVPST